MPLSEAYKVKVLGEIEDEALIRFVYVSQITFKSRLETKLFSSIIRKAKKNNKKRNVTGILCYGNGRFLQCLEGKKEVVIPLVNKIKKDLRHKNLEVLLIEPITKRMFKQWSMRQLFLERWLWYPGTKEQSDQLAKFMPFKPYGWSTQKTVNFLEVISMFMTPPHVKVGGITFNALEKKLAHIIAPHQAFIVVQSILGILLIIAIVLIYQLNI